MGTPSEKLAASLEVLKELQDREVVAIRSRDLSRTHRERLMKNGFLQEVIKGWYVPARPDEIAGESTAWYAAFWEFCASYLESRFSEDWCLSPEQSLALHTGNLTVPRQLLVRTKKKTNNLTDLPHNTSLLDTHADLPSKNNSLIKDGLRIFSIPSALIASAPSNFLQNPTDFRAALAMLGDASELLEILLENGHTTIASRLAGAFRNIGRDDITENIINTMQAADYKVREIDPFETASPMIFSKRARSPYVSRIQLLWQRMREDVLEKFPTAPRSVKNKSSYLKKIDDLYTSDAYHSLSIEGYRVSPDLIERVKSGKWNPDDIESDREHRDAMAARGYWQSFQEVKTSIEKILDGENPGTTLRRDHTKWYTSLFAPGVTAGILRTGDLSGYRNAPVYIRRSKHVPPNKEAVRDLMPAYFDLLEKETEPSARAVLGHFIFVYIHPYMDGNGRIGRFTFNAMLASGGYSWTIIPIEKRDAYMACLESASVDLDIIPFTKFLSDLVTIK